MALLSELIEYSQDIISGKLIACQKHKWACQRFLDDIANQGTEGFPYIFNEEKADHFLDWMRLFKHTKGELEGTFIEPHIIQKFIFGNVYGWVCQDTGYRRFRKLYWQVGRKNAKSQSLAIVGLYEMSAFGEPCSEVYVAATKKDQTKYVWKEADIIYRRCPELKNKFTTTYGTIMHPKSESFFARMSKDDKINGDGSNPQCGIIDEYHAHDTSEYYDILTSGMKMRKQPLLIIITTAGFDLNHPCYKDEYSYVSKILDPNIDISNDRYCVMICELDKGDNFKDEENWLKANPIVASTQIGIESLRDELKVAIDKPDKMRDFMTKSMNIWVNQRNNGYIAMDKWKKCGASKKNPFPDVTKLPVINGIDLSAILDLTSVSFEIDLPDGKKAVMSHSFIPEDTLAVKTVTDKVPYALWVEQKWITATPGATVDYNYILKYLDDTYELYNWDKKESCFDRYLATWLRYELESRGYIAVDVAQGIPSLGEPTKDFKKRIYEGNIIHDNNPVLTWAISNAVTKEDHNANIMLSKEKSSERIDPIAALINAHTRAVINENKTSIYETRGVR